MEDSVQLNFVEVSVKVFMEGSVEAIHFHERFRGSFRGSNFRGTLVEDSVQLYFVEVPVKASVEASTAWKCENCHGRFHASMLSWKLPSLLWKFHASMEAFITFMNASVEAMEASTGAFTSFRQKCR